MFLCFASVRGDMLWRLRCFEHVSVLPQRGFIGSEARGRAQGMLVAG
jgi:hypothetical protein